MFAEAGVGQRRAYPCGVRTLFNDARYGWRTLARSPGFTVVALLTLTLGIGANTAIFSVVNAVLIRSLPFHDPGRLVMVWEDYARTGFPQNTPAPGNYADWKADRNIFDDAAALALHTYNLSGDGAPEKLDGAGVTSNLFRVLGIEPVLGRAFTGAEDTPGAAREVLISHGLWTRRFGADPKLVGRPILLNGANYKVIGVMPSGFHFPSRDFELWTPIAFTAQELAARDSHYLNVVARLQRGVTLERANAQLRVMAKRDAVAYPDGDSDLEGFFAQPLRDYYTVDVRRGLIVLMLAVGCILLIACANIANLLLSRSSARSREIAVRTAVGASRSRIVRQLLTESALLSIGGGALGLLLAAWCFAFLKNLIPDALASTVSLRLDWSVLGFSMFISVASSAFFGLLPALRTSRVDLNEVLKEGARGAVGGRGRGLRSGLVIAEVALSSMVLIGASLLLASFSNLRGLDPGFRADHVLTMQINQPPLTVEEAGNHPEDFLRRLALFSRLLERVRAMPGVKAAGMTSALPLTWKGGSVSFTAEGQPPVAGLVYDANNRVISPGYFEALHISMKRGRAFDERDGKNAPMVSIVNETMAKQFWPGVDPIRHRMKIGGLPSPFPWATIVGIVHDTRNMGLNEPVRAEMYFPYGQSGRNWMVPRDLAILTSGDPMKLADAVRQAVWSIDKNQPVSKIQTLDELLDGEVAQRRVQSALLGAFAALALILACVGIYGVMSYMVARRTREIGVRLALGADARTIFGDVAREGLTMTAAGIAAGISAALILSRLLAALVFGVSANEPRIYIGTAALFVLVALLACYVPARRAARIDPMEALRYE